MSFGPTNGDTIHGAKSTIQLHGLMKHFGKTEVLRGIDLEVPEGAIYALMGTNGAVLTLRWGGWDEGSNRPHWRACPALPLTVTQYRLVDRTTVDLLLSNFTLPPVGVVDQSK